MTSRRGEKREGKCCGLVERAVDRSREKREARRENGQPWVVLKIAVVITCAIIVYAYYVYIGRFCVPAIKHNSGPLGGRRIGIPFLVVFCLLGVMIWWSYIKVIVTSPGKAKEHEQQCDPPPLPPNFRWWDSNSDLGHGPYNPPTMRQAGENNAEHDPPHSAGSNNGSTLASGHLSDKSHRQQASYEENLGVTDTIVPRPSRRNEGNEGEGAHRNGDVENGMPPSSELPMKYTRKPSTLPILLPEHRYCMKDSILKPMRTHHCRACGTCILKYDHHCPWIGQCVGARNHKFFVNFLFWALVFCAWIFASLLANVIKANIDPNETVDPQQIAIVVLAGMFSMFTSALLVTHLDLITMNYTTVEKWAWTV